MGRAYPPFAKRYVPSRIRHGRVIGRLLWTLGFDYKTCRRWS